MELDREDFVFVNSVTELVLPDGDYDFDGDVDNTDFIRWRNQFGNSLLVSDHASGSPSTVVNADGNGDGLVNAADTRSGATRSRAAPRR